jgi:hypothetical protein
MLAATTIRALGGFGYSDGTRRTSERGAHRVIAAGTKKVIAAIPTAAMANVVAVGGVVKATVKNATAHSGIASLR